jgi:hypothetical protein
VGVGVGLGVGVGTGVGTGAGVATIEILAIGPTTTEISSLAENVTPPITTETPTVVTPTATGVRTAVRPSALAASVAAAGLLFVQVGLVAGGTAGSGVNGTTLRFASSATIDRLSICERWIWSLM